MGISPGGGCQFEWGKVREESCTLPGWTELWQCKPISDISKTSPYFQPLARPSCASEYGPTLLSATLQGWDRVQASLLIGSTLL